MNLGWLGGSFDPVHEGHVHIARLAADHWDLSRVLLVPARAPPHKTDRTLAPGADRLALLEIAARADARLSPCDIELRREGLSYSYDTARELHELFGPDTRLHYVIGADTLADLPNWHRIAELCELVTFCSISRAGQELDTAPLAPLIGGDGAAELARNCLRAPPHPASSTAIREGLRAGRRPSYLDDSVWDAIVQRDLYGAGGRTDSSRSGGNSRA